MRLLLTCFCALALSVTYASAYDLNLPFKGKSKVKVAWFLHICDISLYCLPETDITDVLEATPKRLEIEYARSISAESLIKQGNSALEDTFDEATIAQFAEPLDQINAAYVDVRDGDIYALEYIPGKGLSLYLNEKKKLEIEGDEFAAFYLSIWLGDEGKAKEIKEDIFD